MKRLNCTKTLKNQNEYTLALNGELSHIAFSEERAPEMKGKWRSEQFKCDEDTPLDVEVGTGNGWHFAHRAENFPARKIVGMEIKYKPLIQAIRRTQKKNLSNAAICRTQALEIESIFSENEINDVYVHFPDPWTSPRKPQNRIMQKAFLDVLWNLQRPGSMLDFKTDSADAFRWAMKQIADSKYRVEAFSEDLHKSEFAIDNFTTFFESLFLKDQLPIFYCRLRKNHQ